MKVLSEAIRGCPLPNGVFQCIEEGEMKPHLSLPKLHCIIIRWLKARG